MKHLVPGSLVARAAASCTTNVVSTMLWLVIGSMLWLVIGFMHDDLLLLLLCRIICCPRCVARLGGGPRSTRIYQYLVYSNSTCGAQLWRGALAYQYLVLHQRTRVYYY